MNNSTITYYNNNAEQYIQSTFHTSVTQLLNEFCHQIPKKSHILDVGCGSGRDSFYFLQNGYQVTSFDASAELALIASKKINHPVIVANVEDIQWENTFDAVWAMASLLHLKKEDLPLAIKNCIRSLKIENNGKFFAAFKLGNGESYDHNGRFFSYYQQEELFQILKNIDYFDNIQFINNKDSMERNDVNWISFIAEKKPNLILDNMASIHKVKI